MQTAVSNPIALADVPGVQGVQGVFASQVSIANELNSRPFFRRRLMLKDGRVDFFEIVQLYRYLNSVPYRNKEQEVQLSIVTWLQDYRQSMVPGSNAEVMMGQICNDKTLPMLFVPSPPSVAQGSLLNKIWNEAKATLPKKRNVPIVFEESAPQPDVQHSVQAPARPQPPTKPLVNQQAKVTPETQNKPLAQTKPEVAQHAPMQPKSESQSQPQQTPLQKQLKQIAMRPQNVQTAKPVPPEVEPGNPTPQAVVPRTVPKLKDIGEEIPRAAAAVKPREEPVRKGDSQPNQLQPPVKTNQEPMPADERKNELLIQARQSLQSRGVSNITPSLVFAEMMRLSVNT